MATTQECCEQYWTSPGDSTPQSSSYTAAYHPSWKLSKLDEIDMRETAGKVGTSSYVMYSCRPLHMDEQRQDDQFEPTYNSSGGVMVSMLDQQTYTSEFDSHWVSHSCGLVLHLSKKLSKLKKLCADTGCSPEDLPDAMDDREGWRERVRDIRADIVTWWWWWWIITLCKQL